MSDEKSVPISDEDLGKVSGGVDAKYLTQVFVSTMTLYINSLGVDVSEDYVRGMIEKGGSALRDFALDRTGHDARCYVIPVIE